MTKPSPWKTAAEAHTLDPGEFRVEITEREVLRLINTLKGMAPSANHAFFILLATMLHMAKQNGVSKEELIDMLTREILAHKVTEQ